MDSFSADIRIRSKRSARWLENRGNEIWQNLQKNHLWQRMLKNIIAVTITVILGMIPAVTRIYGKAVYLGTMTAVFGHPGRRFGQMAEALVLTISGTLLGTGWSMFGIYLSSLVYESNSSAAYTIRGIFLAIAVLFHGFLRSHTPRLFIFVLLLVVVSVVSMTSTAKTVSTTSVTNLLYPILTACGILILVNLLIFPEFSSNFLGVTTIKTLHETINVLRDAGRYFASVEEIKAGQEKHDGTAGNVESEDSKEDAGTEPQILFFQRVQTFLGSRKAQKPGIAAPFGPPAVKLKNLTDSKAKLRASLASCKSAQQECNFELAWAFLPPRDLKPVSDNAMRKLVANTIALIGACESKYSCIGDREGMQELEGKYESQLRSLAKAANVDIGDEPSRPTTGVESLDESGDNIQVSKRDKRKFSGWKVSRDKSRTSLEKDIADLALVKPRKEIEFGDTDLLKSLINRIAEPLGHLQKNVDTSADVVTSCLAYCYDVPKLPSGALAPTGIELQEIDIRVDILVIALADFDRDSAAALEDTGDLHDLEIPRVDIMPRMEIFLISSFLLNLRQAALHTLDMLRHCRVIVERRQARHGRRRIYAPRIQWRKWLASGGEEDSYAMPDNARKDIRNGKRDDADEDDSTSSKKGLLKTDIEVARPAEPHSPSSISPSSRKSLQKGSLTYRLRNGLADFVEYIQESEDILYAVKLTIAVFLVTWPAFIGAWNTWYSLNRGLWAALQLVLITEVAIGTSVRTFIIRSVGTTIGCLWGWGAYEARHGNRYVCVVILVIGIIPSTYIQLGSQYVKAGMVSIISMCIVALATVDCTVPSSGTENFLKRLIAFLIGGIVALIIEVILFPVKARDRLVESLACSLVQINEMEACLAHGIESEANIDDVHTPLVSMRFERAKNKAQGALTAAETFLPFCGTEPRIKGSFKGLALVYAEILYVLHAIVDRMDNMLALRSEYGSGVLEELNAKVHPYRRNVYGSVTVILFAVHEALITKLPLPQFLPSARLAHLRLINRVREVVLHSDTEEYNQFHEEHDLQEDMNITMVKRIVKQKFLSWNAVSAGQIEVIEYLEELVDLTKLLVGANEFRSGLLTRDAYRDYVGRMSQAEGGSKEERGQVSDMVVEKEVKRLGMRSRRTTNLEGKEAEGKKKTDLEKGADKEK